MKIAVASDDQTKIADHFGRCAGFIIFEITAAEAKKIDFRANQFGHHDHGNHDDDHESNHHSHDGFVGALADCTAVICRGMGRRARADLAAAGISPAVTGDNLTAQAAAELYARGDLKTSDDSTCCTH